MNRQEAINEVGSRIIKILEKSSIELIRHTEKIEGYTHCSIANILIFDDHTAGGIAKILVTMYLSLDKKYKNAKFEIKNQ